MRETLEQEIHRLGLIPSKGIQPLENETFVEHWRGVYKKDDLAIEILRLRRELEDQNRYISSMLSESGYSY